MRTQYPFGEHGSKGGIQVRRDYDKIDISDTSVNSCTCIQVSYSEARSRSRFTPHGAENISNYISIISSELKRAPVPTLLGRPLAEVPDPCSPNGYCVLKTDALDT